MEILETQGLYKHFGGLYALNNVSLTIRQGELTSIIGPNGAGKTTLYNVLTGKLTATKGKVLYKGRDITKLPPHKRTKLGLSRTFQITNIFRNMSVLDNLRVARIIRKGQSHRLFRAAEKNLAIIEESIKILKMLDLEDRKDFLCTELSHGDCRIVEVGLALANEPDLLFLDEPTAGMNPRESQQIVAIIRRLFEKEGVNIVITEHDMNIVFSISDRIVVLHQGEILADGKPGEIRQDARVVAAYFGKGSKKE